MFAALLFYLALILILLLLLILQVLCLNQNFCDSRNIRFIDLFFCFIFVSSISLVNFLYLKVLKYIFSMSNILASKIVFFTEPLTSGILFSISPMFVLGTTIVAKPQIFGINHAYLVEASITYNKYLTPLFLEDNDLISAKFTTQILSLNVAKTFLLLNFLPLVCVILELTIHLHLLPVLIFCQKTCTSYWVVFFDINQI